MKQKLVLNFKTSNDVSGMQKDHKKKRKKEIPTNNCLKAIMQMCLLIDFFQIFD